MSQCFAALEHRFPIKPSSALVFPTDIDATLISPAGPFVYPIERNFLNRTSVHPIKRCRIVRAVSVNIRSRMHMRPNFFIRTGSFHPVYDCFFIRSDNRAEALPSAFVLTVMDKKVLIRKDRQRIPYRL